MNILTDLFQIGIVPAVLWVLLSFMSGLPKKLIEWLIVGFAILGFIYCLPIVWNNFVFL